MNTTSRIKKRIIEISYQRGLTHIGSCLTAVDIIYKIYVDKKDSEPFVLSQGHAGLALYAVLEELKGHNAEILLENMGIHPDRLKDPTNSIDCSSGSLGHGLPIALGMALADRKRNVYCLTSDGELAEGSCYETANIMRKYQVRNLKVYVNWNGYTGYDKSMVRKKDFNDVFKIVNTSSKQRKYRFLRGLKGHYAKLTADDYEQMLQKI